MSSDKPKYPNQNRMKIPKVDIESLLNNVRYIEDSVESLIRRTESGCLEKSAFLLGLKDIRKALKKLTDVD